MKTPLMILFTAIAPIVLVPCLALAELGAAGADTTTATTTTTTPPYVTQQLSVMTERLKLSQSQQDRIRPILVAEWNKKQAIEAGTLSEQKKRDAIFANHRAALQKIKAIFTSEQMAQIEREQDHPTASSTNPGS